MSIRMNARLHQKRWCSTVGNLFVVVLIIAGCSGSGSSGFELGSGSSGFGPVGSVSTSPDAGESMESAPEAAELPGSGTPEPAGAPGPPGPAASESTAQEVSRVSTISGVVVKGPLIGAHVRAFGFDNGSELCIFNGIVVGEPVVSENRPLRCALDMTVTGIGGTYAVEIARAYAGPVILEVSDGRYIDEATGEPRQGTERVFLRTVVPSVPPAEGLSVASIQFFSSVAAARIVRESVGAIPTAERIQEINTTVARRFGLDVIAVDIVRVLPVDFMNPGVDVSDDRAIFTILLAGIAQLARDLGGLDPVDLIQALVKDGADGTFDGLEDGDQRRPVIPRGAQRALSAETISEGLADAVERVQSSAGNMTGVNVPPAIIDVLRKGRS